MECGQDSPRESPAGGRCCGGVGARAGQEHWPSQHPRCLLLPAEAAQKYTLFFREPLAGWARSDLM